MVIGAGLAGLSAATVLEEGGADVQVVEARGEVGGRVHSMRRLGSHQEAGGAHIGAGYRRVVAAARRHQVELVDVTPTIELFREQELVLDGELIRRSEWPGHPKNPFPDGDRNLLPWIYRRELPARKTPLSSPEEWLEPRFASYDISVEAWLRGLGLDRQAVRLGYELNASFGDSAGDVSALSVFFRAAFSAAQRRDAPKGVLGYTAKDGVQRIPEEMAGALHREVRLRQVVTAIACGRSGAAVHCADGSVYTARHVVCALPPGVLRRVAVDPPFLGPQEEAIRGLDSQPVTQLHFRPKSSFWEQDGYRPGMFTDGPAGMLVASGAGDDPAKVAGLTAWIFGSDALRLDRPSEADAGRTVLSAIEALRPAARGQLEFVGRTSWGSDPFARGGWTWFRPGQVARLAGEMARPHGSVRFCGEHLATASRGMEGAMESGERAAREVLSA